MTKVRKQQELVIFKGAKGQVKLKGDFHNETIWPTQAEIAQVFGVTPQNITLHIKNIFKDSELVEISTCKESLQVQKEGARTVTRNVNLYNLDVMIAVGYRISSVTGTQFRKWATQSDHYYPRDLLGEQVLRADYNIRIDFDDGSGNCWFDVKAVTSGGSKWTAHINVCEKSTWNLNE
jgi:Virulence protein RhuM family